jgi:hypothetical protein
MVCCFFVRSGFMVFSGLPMMLGGLIVMMCCFLVVFVDFWHGYLPVKRSLTNLRRGWMSAMDQRAWANERSRRGPLFVDQAECVARKLGFWTSWTDHRASRSCHTAPIQ